MSSSLYMTTGQVRPDLMDSLGRATAPHPVPPRPLTGGCAYWGQIGVPFLSAERTVAGSDVPPFPMPRHMPNHPLAGKAQYHVWRSYRSARAPSREAQGVRRSSATTESRSSAG